MYPRYPSTQKIYYYIRTNSSNYHLPRMLGFQAVYLMDSLFDKFGKDLELPVVLLEHNRIKLLWESPYGRTFEAVLWQFGVRQFYFVSWRYCNYFTSEVWSTTTQTAVIPEEVSEYLSFFKSKSTDNHSM